MEERQPLSEGSSGLASENESQDAGLLADAQSGSSDAFDSLFHLHKRFVYNVCYRMIGCGEDAIDATQTTFIRAYKGLKSFRGSCAFRSWLYRIAVNACTEMLRKNARQARMSREIPAPVEETAKDDRLWSAMLELPAGLRAVLVLFYFQQLTVREIAESMNCSEGAAKVRLCRARAALRVRYEEMTQ